jgi:hypothetical protein
MGSTTFQWLEASCEAIVSLFYQEVLYSTVLSILIWGLAYFLKGKTPQSTGSDILWKGTS